MEPILAAPGDTGLSIFFAEVAIVYSVVFVWVVRRIVKRHETWAIVACVFMIAFVALIALLLEMGKNA